MMAGRRALRFIQLGRESTAGTSVAATTIWRGKGTLTDNRKQERVQQDVGIIGGTDEVNQTMLGGTLAVTQTPATFEQFLHVLEASVKTATPSQDGAGTDYIYTYALPTTSGNTIKTYTLEGGDDTGEEEMAYCFVQNWTLQGAGRNAYQLTANWQGREVVPSTKTGSLTLPAVNYMNFGLTSVYIDAIGGTYGSTIKSNTVRGIKLDLKSGIEAKNTADGRLDFSFAQGTEYDFKGQIEFEHDSTALAEKINWRAMTAKKIQIKIVGTTAFGTPGTTYSVPTLLFNLPLRWSNFEKINEANGNDIVTGSFFSAYNTTVGGAGSIIDVVELSAVP
jgi:hypothetical protein